MKTALLTLLLLTQSSLLHAESFKISRKMMMKKYPDPMRILDTFEAQPAMDNNGNISGIRLTKFSKECPLTSYGALEGDLITKVNKDSINGFEDIVIIGQKLSKLKNRSAVTVKIVRNKKEISHSYLIQE